MGIQYQTHCPQPKVAPILMEAMWWSWGFNSLSPGTCGTDFESVIFKLWIQNSSLGISCEIALMWIPQDLTTGNVNATLVQVMAWCRQAPSHYLSQCWPRSMSSFGVTKPQWVKMWLPKPLERHHVNSVGDFRHQQDHIYPKLTYCQTSSISYTKTKDSIVYCHVLQLALPYQLNPDIKSKNEDVDGAVPTGGALITSEWSTGLLP